MKKVFIILRSVLVLALDETVSALKSGVEY